MEKMQINLISVVERQGSVVARARAQAEQARISVEVWFKAVNRHVHLTRFRRRFVV